MRAGRMKKWSVLDSVKSALYKFFDQIGNGKCLFSGLGC